MNTTRNNTTSSSKMVDALENVLYSIVETAVYELPSNENPITNPSQTSYIRALSNIVKVAIQYYYLPRHEILLACIFNMFEHDKQAKIIMMMSAINNAIETVPITHIGPLLFILLKLGANIKYICFMTQMMSNMWLITGEKEKEIRKIVPKCFSNFIEPSPSPII